MSHNHYPEITEINPAIIKKFNSEDDFMILGVELSKEVAILQTQISAMYKVDDKGQMKRWNKQEAILAALLARINRLSSAFVDNICQQRFEICQILSRCRMESVINLKYLIKNNTEETFKNFIYSLHTENKFLDCIEENIKERGYETPIENRMIKSIKKSFDKAGLEIKDLGPKKVYWGGSILKKFKELNMEKFYISYELQCHAIHGNWQDLVQHYLVEFDDGYEIDFDWTVPRPQVLIPEVIIMADICMDYLQCQFADYSEDLIDLTK